MLREESLGLGEAHRAADDPVQVRLPGRDAGLRPDGEGEVDAADHQHFVEAGTVQDMSDPVLQQVQVAGVQVALRDQQVRDDHCQEAEHRAHGRLQSFSTRAQTSPIQRRRYIRMQRGHAPEPQGSSVRQASSFLASSR